MSLILNIETATTVCSVSIFDGTRLLGFRQQGGGYTHAENLHIFIDQLFKELKLSGKDLSAVCVSKGPGSYTGLRIGVSAAKGLSFALGIPLIGIDTLTIMTAAAREEVRSTFYCPMIDARRMEVYCSVLDDGLRTVRPIAAEIITEERLEIFRGLEGICFFGDGMTKCRSLLEKLEGAVFAEGCLPSAKFMGYQAYERFGAKNFEDTAAFEPFYLKEFVTGGKSV